MTGVMPGDWLFHVVVYALWLPLSYGTLLSIVQDEADDPVDLAVPAAGALVLLGWAGHIVYLNRLAKLL